MDLLPLVSRLSIQTKDLRVVRLGDVINHEQAQYLSAIQEQMNRGVPIRLIVLKARQMGISTITEAVGFNLCFLWEGLQGLIVSHELDSSQHLLSMTQRYWETWPFKAFYQNKYESQKNLAWKNNSSLRVTTAKNVGSGRSRTIHFLHASEVAFWPEPETLMAGLRQTIPNSPETMIVLESTANGMGNYFHTEWLRAEEGDSEYVPLFFPWHHFNQYTASAAGIPITSLGHLDDEERVLQRIGLSDDRLLWRRWAIKELCQGDINTFHQEYPTTPEEAFIATGLNVFPLEKLNNCYQPMEGHRGYLLPGPGNRIEFTRDPTGPLTIYRYPSRDRDWGVYFIGGDATGTTRGDYAVAQVISRRTAEQVAVFRKKMDPGTFADELAKLGRYYNDAMVAPEIEGPGYATIGRLQVVYPFIWRHQRPDHTPGKIVGDIHGWSTTAQSKHLAIGTLLKFVVDTSVTIHDRITYYEMRNYVTLDTGGYGPADERGNDDTVMAMAIAMTGHNMEPPVPGYVGDNPIHGDPEKKVPVWEGWDEHVGSY